MENNVNQKIEYSAYHRKSTESEDRQILSIDSQIDKSTEMAKALGIKLKEENIFTESKSAKVTNNRPGFKKMVDEIEKGKISGIISWHADRLSRNAIDSAILIDLMDRNKLIEIVTPGQTFRNTPFDKFMFMLSCTQAKMENDKKAIDVKRGMAKAASKGNFPGVAPVGYINDKYLPKGQKHTSKDPERFEIVRKMWDLMLTGTVTPLHVWKVATNEWGLTMRNGRKLSRNIIYWIFRNPFYAGSFEYPRKSGNWHQGTYEPMITLEEYDRVQIILGKKGNPRPKSHIFEFTGMMRCGECYGSITAEIKTKRPKNGKVHVYVYYHCTKRVHKNCTQGSVEVDELKKQVAKEINSVEIPSEFHSYAMKWFRNENEKEAGSQKVVLGANQKGYDASVEKLSNLIDMRSGGEISPEDFTKKQEQYLSEKNKFKKLLDGSDNRIDQWNQTSNEMLTFIEKAQERFKNGTLQTKRSILSTLGSNLIIKDKIISIDIEKSLFPMKKISIEVKAIKERLEPLNTLEKQKQFEQMCDENPMMCAQQGSNLRHSP
jgi:site-specific DNA recombinase